MVQSESGDWVVFISHSSADTWIANQIAKEISARGASTFLDESDVLIGEDIEGKILNALTRANELVALLTPWSIERPYVWAEIGGAWIRQIPIIGILYGMSVDELLTNSRIPLFIKRRDFIQLNEIETYFEQLTRRIRST